MENNLSEDIGKKLQVIITLGIFLIVVIERFFNKFQPEKAQEVSFGWIVLVALYIFSYGLYYRVKKKIADKDRFMIYANKWLTWNFLILSYIILHTGITEFLDRLPDLGILLVSSVFYLCLFFIAITPVLLIILFLIRKPFPKDV